MFHLASRGVQFLEHYPSVAFKLYLEEFALALGFSEPQHCIFVIITILSLKNYQVAVVFQLQYISCDFFIIIVSDKECCISKHFAFTEFVATVQRCL